MGKRRVRLQDIAECAGVSVSTVSLVLNDKARVGNVRISKQTIRRVRHISREMGYLSRGVVGLVVPQFGQYFLGMIDGVMEVLKEEKYNLALGMTTGWHLQREIEEAQLMDNKGFDGLIIGSSPQFVAKLENTLYIHHTRKRMVVMNWVSHSGIPYVTIDHQHCGYLATKHLIEQGHRRIAFAGVHYPTPEHVTDIPIIDARFKGYLKALKECDLPYISVEPVEAVLDLPKKVTGVYCGRVLGSLDLLGACWDRGIRVPDDLSIVGQDEGRDKSAVRPRMTTIDVYEKKVGAQAAQMILDLINGKETESIVLKPRLIKRDSVRAL